MQNVTLADAQAAAAKIIEANVLTSGGESPGRVCGSTHQNCYCFGTGLRFMDTKEIFSAVGNFGFPMVLSWYLLLRMEQRLDKLTDCLNELSKALLQNTREL